MVKLEPLQLLFSRAIYHTAAHNPIKFEALMDYR